MQMMFADQADRRRLSALLAYFCNEPDLVTDGETLEGIIENAFAVEIDFTAIVRLDEPIILADKEFRDAAMIFDRMRLHIAAHFTRSILDLALRGRESILDRNLDMLMFGHVTMRTGHENILPLRHRDPNRDRVQTALAMPRVGRDDSDVATRDVVVELFEPLSVFCDFSADGFRRLEILERNVQRYLHEIVLSEQIEAGPSPQGRPRYLKSGSPCEMSKAGGTSGVEGSSPMPRSAVLRQINRRADYRALTPQAATEGFDPR
jgi:hypothetical protein